ncbi:hypothetical protein XENOCAPTIV_011390 [Xenoophorus captivus]|uniref:Uncharacterized protein n=1 Tax=Xenoophorus captivus TaxID=1517983 RepID=A0ABV0R861_9TELE
MAQPGSEGGVPLTSWLTRSQDPPQEDRACMHHSSQTDLTSSNIASHLSLSPAQMPLQKLLFSATLTQNPEKLQQLGLYQPQLFSSVHSPSSSTTEDPTQKQERFDFPQGLTVRGDL